MTGKRDRTARMHFEGESKHGYRKALCSPYPLDQPSTKKVGKVTCGTCKKCLRSLGKLSKVETSE